MVARTAFVNLSQRWGRPLLVSAFLRSVGRSRADSFVLLNVLVNEFPCTVTHKFFLSAQISCSPALGGYPYMPHMEVERSPPTTFSQGHHYPFLPMEGLLIVPVFLYSGSSLSSPLHCYVLLSSLFLSSACSTLSLSRQLHPCFLPPCLLASAHLPPSYLSHS
jgi:hypothetical protein